MQNAETVLQVIRERGKRGLSLERLYRQLFNPQLYLLAYGRLYKNEGAMTRGTTTETVSERCISHTSQFCLSSYLFPFAV